MRSDHGGAPAGLGRALVMVPVRWSGLTLALAFAALGMWVECAVAMLVALAQVVGWRSRLPLPWEVATSTVCLIAAISSFLLLYEILPWWDLPMHAALTGLLAVLVARVVRPGRLCAHEVMVTGIVLAVVWELMELAGWWWVDSSVQVAPADTALDLVAGCSGALVAALLWRRRDRAAHGEQKA